MTITTLDTQLLGNRSAFVENYEFMNYNTKPGYNAMKSLLSLFLIVSISSAFAGGIPVNLDVAQFQDPNQQSYLEIYYSIPQGAVSYQAGEGGGFACQVVMDLQIYQGEKLWSSKIWKIEKSFPDTSEMDPNSHFVDVFRYIIDKPVSYHIAIHVKDLMKPEMMDSVSTVFDCVMFSPEKLEISDIELASQISRAAPEANNIFMKGVYEVIPNPSGLYGEGASELFYYFEAYNLQTLSGGTYKTQILVKDTEGRVVPTIVGATRTKKKRHNTSVEMGKIDVANVPTGKYVLVYGILDSAEQVLKMKEKSFFVFNPTVSRQVLAGSETVSDNDLGPLQSLSEKELDREFEQMIYITKEEDRKFYKNLSTPQAKRKFIYSIWQNPRIPYAVSTGLPYRENYILRVKNADANFSSVFRPGWKSDRGRVFILYGPPTNVERFPSSQTTLPYEIWTYDYLNGQSAVTFIFSDFTGFSKYELVHSTLRGELQQPDWLQLITRGAGGYRN